MNATIKCSTVAGSTVYPFDQMVKDTVKAHGWLWAFGYYVVDHGLPAWQFDIFCGNVGHLSLGS